MRPVHILRERLLALGPYRAREGLKTHELRELLNDTDIRVRYLAAFELDFNSRDVTTRQALDILLQALYAEDNWTRASAGEVAEEILYRMRLEEKELATEVLVEIHNSTDEKMRAEAIWALDMMEADSLMVVDACIELLEDRNEYVRTMTTIRLGEIGDNRAINPLIRLLSEAREPCWRARAAAILGKLGNPMAVEPLVEALGDSDASVNWNVIHSLGQIGDARAILALERVIEQDTRDLHGLSLVAEAVRAMQHIRDRNERLGGIQGEERDQATA